MAVTKFGPLLRTTATPRKGFYVDQRRPVEIYLLTKLTGETTYSLASNFTKVKTATVYDPTDAALAAITTAVATPSSSAAGTIDLSVLGAGTQLIVVVEGFEKTAN